MYFKLFLFLLMITMTIFISWKQKKRKEKENCRGELKLQEALSAAPQQQNRSVVPFMSLSCESEWVNFLDLCAETTFQSSLNLTFPDVNSFQTSWLFEACPSGAALVSSPAAEREWGWGGGGAGLIQVWNVVAKHNIRGSGVALPYLKMHTCSVWGLWVENILNLRYDKGTIWLDRELRSQYVFSHHYYITVGLGRAISLSLTSHLQSISVSRTNPT